MKKNMPGTKKMGKNDQCEPRHQKACAFFIS